jgi:hypothetical protein
VFLPGGIGGYYLGFDWAWPRSLSMESSLLFWARMIERPMGFVKVWRDKVDDSEAF